MKFKFILSLMMGAGAMTAFAQGGYQDGIDYYNADRFEDAQEILNNTLNDAGTNKALSYFYLGSIELREGKTDAAKALFDKGVAADATCGYNYIGLGQIALKGGDKKAAENYFKQGLNTNKKDPKLMAAIARAYYNVDPVAYKKQFDEYIKKAMKESKNLESAVYVLLGDTVTNDPGEAAGKYEQAIEYDNQKGIINPEAYVKYANVYIRTNPTFAIQKLVDLNELLPTSALAQRELAEKYYDNNQLTLAAQQYGKYMQNPNHFQRDEQRYSGLLYFAGDYPKSLEVAKGVLAKDPQNPYMWRMVMLNEAGLKNYPAAIEAGKKLFATPNTELTFNDWSTYGDALAASEQYEEALKAYENAIKLRPEKVDVYTRMSTVYNNLKNYAKAAEYQQMYIDNEKEPSLTDIYMLGNRYKNLSISLPEGSAERVAAAETGITYVNKAIASAADESKPSMLRNLATLYVLRDNGVKDDAAQTYEQMLKFYDQDPANKTKNVGAYKAAYQSLGNYYLDKGDKETARKYFELMLEVDPENAALRDYLKNL